MNLKYYILGVFLFYLDYQFKSCETVKITYVSTERPVVYWVDTKYFRKASLTSKRFSRRDHRYYVEFYTETLFTVNNNLTLHFYFYQFLTNRYRPSFVEVHFGFCDLLEREPLFGQPMKMGLGNRSCPLPPGTYDLKNMSILEVPNGFPFAKGRIYCNVTHSGTGVAKHVLYAKIDMEIKTFRM